VVGVAVGLALGPRVGLAVALVVVVALGLTTGISAQPDTVTPDPRTIVRNDLASGLGLTNGILGGLATAVLVSTQLGFGCGCGLVVVVVFSFTGALDAGRVGDP
jgi:hypothetical protein